MIPLLRALLSLLTIFSVARSGRVGRYASRRVGYRAVRKLFK